MHFKAENLRIPKHPLLLFLAHKGVFFLVLHCTFLYNVHQCVIPICMFTVQVHSIPVYSTGAHKTKPVSSTGVKKAVYSTGAHKTSLNYRCTQNQFTVQVRIKLV